jgi:hypothetical protein
MRPGACPTPQEDASPRPALPFQEQCGGARPRGLPWPPALRCCQAPAATPPHTCQSILAGLCATPQAAGRGVSGNSTRNSGRFRWIFGRMVRAAGGAGNHERSQRGSADHRQYRDGRLRQGAAVAGCRAAADVLPSAIVVCGSALWPCSLAATGQPGGGCRLRDCTCILALVARLPHGDHVVSVHFVEGAADGVRHLQASTPGEGGQRLPSAQRRRLMAAAGLHAQGAGGPASHLVPPLPAQAQG